VQVLVDLIIYKSYNSNRNVEKGQMPYFIASIRQNCSSPKNMAWTLDPEIDRIGLNDPSEFNSGRLDRSTRLLTGLTIDSTSLNFDRLNRSTRLQLIAAILKQRRSDAR
jgi:hypothetical protein